MFLKLVNEEALGILHIECWPLKNVFENTLSLESLKFNVALIYIYCIASTGRLGQDTGI